MKAGGDTAIEAAKRDGAGFVETGVWRGGAWAVAMRGSDVQARSTDCFDVEDCSGGMRSEGARGIAITSAGGDVGNLWVCCLFIHGMRFDGGFQTAWK